MLTDDKDIELPVKLPAEQVLRVKKQLSEQRWLHTIEVLKTGVALCKNYPQLERLQQELIFVSLHHDMAKELPDPLQLELARKYRLPVDNYELKIPELRHGPAAAALVIEQFGYQRTERIPAAIANHSTGAANDAPLADALVVADFCAADRSFPAAEAVRRLIGIEPLSELIRITLKNKLIDCLEKGALIHPRSIKAYNRFVH